MSDVLTALSEPSYESLRAMQALDHMDAFQRLHRAELEEQDQLLALASWISGAIAFWTWDPDVPTEAIASARDRLLAINRRLDQLAAVIAPAWDAWMADFNMPEPD